MHETNWKGLIPMPESLIFFHEEREREFMVDLEKRWLETLYNRRFSRTLV